MLIRMNTVILKNNKKKQQLIPLKEKFLFKTKCKTFSPFSAVFDGCNSHGDCYRYGRHVDEFSCCCYPGTILF